MALLVNNRIVPCCVPRRARWRDLRGITFEGVQGRLDPPQHLDVVQDTVTFRSGDCFRVDTEREHDAATEYAQLEDVDHETAEVASYPLPGATSGCGSSLLVRLGLLSVLAVTPRSSLPWAGFFGYVVCSAMHRPGGFPWQTPAHERNFSLPNTETQIQVLYYSPFLGNFPAYWATTAPCGRNF